MIVAPLGMIAADRIQSMVSHALQPIFSRGTNSFDEVMKKQESVRIQHAKAVGLVGAEVTVENRQGARVTGIVESVELNNQGAVLQINGQKFDLAQLKEVLKTKNSGENV